MPEESTTRDLVERTRQSIEAANRRDLDASATSFAEAIHGYLDDWTSAHDEQRIEQWEGQHIGNGVVFAVVLFQARPVGSQSSVRERWAFAAVWSQELITRVVASPEIALARAEAERLAGSRG